jgi:putative hemolysin
MAWQIIVVFLLTLLNGFFSMSEIALVTVRKTRISSLVKQGSSGAKIVQSLQQNPESLFATIQIGISVLTITASVFAGSSIAEKLAQGLAGYHILFISNHAYAISFTLVVAIVSYVSLILGELVPKSLGLRYAETFSLIAAYPIWWISKIFKPLIKGLSFSSNLFLSAFKDSTSFGESRISEDEIRSLISEGRNAGTIEPHEYGIIENVFDFSDLSVEKIMVPRSQMAVFDITLPTKEIIHKAIESGYSRIPIYRESVNNIVGILYTKRLLARFDRASENLDIHEFLVPPYFVPGSMKISEVLQKLQRKKAHMAMVADEHGEIAGLVSMEDLLEEIVGDITDETDEAADMEIRKENDYHIASGKISILDFNRYFKTGLPEDGEYNTLSGFVIEQLGRFPKIDDVVRYEKLEIIVKDATMRTVKTAIIKLSGK